VQVPALSNDTVVPETAQTLPVADANVTTKPDVDVPLNATVPPAVCAPSKANVIVWALPFTAKLCATVGAAAYDALPACDATIVQVPEVNSVAVPPATVQTPVVEEANATGRPDVEEALSETVPPAVCAAIVENVMVCD
jgi:hypothetical protein